MTLKVAQTGKWELLEEEGEMELGSDEGEVLDGLVGEDIPYEGHANRKDFAVAIAMEMLKAGEDSCIAFEDWVDELNSSSTVPPPFHPSMEDPEMAAIMDWMESENLVFVQNDVLHALT